MRVTTMSIMVKRSGGATATESVAVAVAPKGSSTVHVTVETQSSTSSSTQSGACGKMTSRAMESTEDTRRTMSPSAVKVYLSGNSAAVHWDASRRNRVARATPPVLGRTRKLPPLGGRATTTSTRAKPVWKAPGSRVDVSSKVYAEPEISEFPERTKDTSFGDVSASSAREPVPRLMSSTAVRATSSRGLSPTRTPDRSTHVAFRPRLTSSLSPPSGSSSRTRTSPSRIRRDDGLKGDAGALSETLGAKSR
mmetsp:Transcript_30315/g.97737  ORF Transcript_30315/g.97737 Transcript_30315/m.97737 type:complete len:251 (+) Transcript_30315:389-1141(+)